MDDRIGDNRGDHEADPVQRGILKPGPRSDLESALTATSMFASLEFSIRNVVCVAPELQSTRYYHFSGKRRSYRVRPMRRCKA
jgi:hypothetical protein